jgi:lipopolysaccharide transport system ATP-binding protein
MADAIKAEGLGKRYVLSHQSRAPYSTLRESLGRGLRGLFRGGEVRDEFWALRGLDLAVPKGQRIGVIGHNGAGKSTLLKLLSRITDPSEGRISMRGRVASLLEVGTGFHPELSGRENIYLNGAVLGMRRSEVRAKFDAIVAFAEVERFLDTPVKRYSSGMYMRLAFAVAAHLDPEILIVDEVLAVGDAAFQKKCLGKMAEVGESGRTLIFVSHQMNAVERLCQRVVVLEKGRLRLDTTDIGAGIAAYMNAGGQAASRWTNDGGLAHEAFTPESFYVSDESGRPLSGAVSNNSGFGICVRGTVRTADPALDLGVAVFAEGGELLFWSCQNDRSEAHWPRLEPGPHSLFCRFPRRILNQGSYRVELIVALHYRQWISAPGKNAPAIHLEILGGLSDSPLWVERRPGLLGPELDWSELGHGGEEHAF